MGACVICEMAFDNILLVKDLCHLHDASLSPKGVCTCRRFWNLREDHVSFVFAALSFKRNPYSFHFLSMLPIAELVFISFARRRSKPEMGLLHYYQHPIITLPFS